MDEQNEAHRIIPELYFLIAKFLSGGPLKETAKTLLRELQSVEVLPRRLDWEGSEHSQSYEELASQFTDISWDRLAAVCESALKLARAASIPPLPPSPPAPSNGESSPPAQLTLPAPSSPEAVERVQEVGSRIAPRLSLLNDSLVRGKPKYASFKQDHSLARRLAYRELGLGFASELGGRGGAALLSPRFLCSLQLQRRTLGHLSAVYCLVFDCTGRYVVTGADDLLVKVWSAEDGRLLATLRGAGAEITDVCASADGALLAAGSVERLVRVWCLATGAPRAVLSAHAGTITAVHWAPPARRDERWLASTSTDGSVAFWTAASDGQFLSRPVQYVERTRPGACHMICAAWSAGGGFLAAGSADHHVRIYSVDAPGGPRRVAEIAAHNDAVDSVSWAHRGLKLVSGSKDGTAALWALSAGQWRPRLLLPPPPAHKRLKVTMVCWDRSDQFVMTAVSDNTIRVWCARTCAQVSILRGHRDEAYVLEPHPILPGVLLSAGHDGQLLVWHARQTRPLAAFHNRIEQQGDGAIFDAKWGGPCSIAASDSHGHLLLFGIGQGPSLLKTLPTELFFHTDYRPLVRDALGGALDEQTELPPHLMPPPFLVDVEGAPHAPELQRLVPGRRRLPLAQLVPAQPSHAALDRRIQQLAGEPPPQQNHAPNVWRELVPAQPSHAALDRRIQQLAGEPPPQQNHAPNVWRREGVRHTSGSWQRGEPLMAAHAAIPLVAPLPPARVAHIQKAAAEMHALEAAWYRREMRRRPVMISTGPAPAAPQQTRRRRGRPPPNASRPPPPRRTLIREEPPEPEPEIELSSSETSDSSVRLSGSGSGSHHSTARSTSPSSRSSSSSSQYSDWEAGPPARARRRPVPTTRYSPSVSTPTKRQSRPATPAASTSTSTAPIAHTATTAHTGDDDLYRVGEWLTAIAPKKAPYHPQIGDECLYFRLGHQRYFEAVAEKDLYKINPRDKPWERTHIHDCELVKVIGIKYVIKPPRVVCLRLARVLEPRRAFTVRYHDMPDVIDFMVLRKQYDAAAARQWAPPQRFRCMIDDSWWCGVIAERSEPNPAPDSTAALQAAGSSGGTAGPQAIAAAFSAAASPHFLSLKVRWDNGEMERLSPWDLEPIDPERQPSEPGGAVPVLPHELDAVLYRAEPHEWPPHGDRAAACRAIAHHLSQVMTLSVAEPFIAPVDLSLYPEYARVVPYPVDLATVRGRFQHQFYRRAAAAQFDVRYLASNAEQFNEAHSPIVRQARLVTDLLLIIISQWQTVDVLAKYRELAASYHSSDDEPRTTNQRNKTSSRGGWVEWCERILNELLASADAAPFKQPVSPEQAPDYLSVVSSPMDLGTVQKRLQTRYYKNRRQFASDIRRVIANSRLYNTNPRSRIYSMTVRLSALFESLWQRAPPAPPRAREPREPRARKHTRVKINGHASPQEPRLEAPSDSSDSETLAATSRRQHAGRGRRGDEEGASPDSDAPLRAHRKGKGVGKKSKRVVEDSSPAPGPSTQHEAAPVPSRARRRFESSDNSDSSVCPPRYTKRRRRKRVTGSESGSGSWTAPALKKPRTLKPVRTRERFESGSLSSSSDSSDELDVELDNAARHYNSDHSYRPKYSSDDDAPLNLYRKRQEGSQEDEEEDEGSSRTGPATHNGDHGVSLRARGSPRRYNEQSDSDSAAAISKRSMHRKANHQHLQRRRRHAQGASTLAVSSDHNYFNGHARAHAHTASTHNGDGSSSSNPPAPAVSISSRGRVRKLTAKARGLLTE